MQVNGQNVNDEVDETTVRIIFRKIFNLNDAKNF